MKIDFLVKDNTQYENLINGLKSAGCDIKTHTVSIRQSLFDIWNLSKIVHETECDLIHNEIGMLPVVLNPSVDKPMLTVLDEPLEGDDFQIAVISSPKCYYASVNMSLIPRVVLNRSFQLDSHDLIGSYMGIYEIIFKEASRIDRRPWGFYEVLSDKNDHKVKRITVYPGKRLSLQSHKRRSEHWVVVSGVGEVTVNDKIFELGKGACVDIPKEAAHRIANTGDSPLVFIEIQMGEYFGEDDIIRLDDDYGRA